MIFWGFFYLVCQKFWYKLLITKNINFEVETSFSLVLGPLKPIIFYAKRGSRNFHNVVEVSFWNPLWKFLEPLLRVVDIGYQGGRYNTPSPLILGSSAFIVIHPFIMRVRVPSPFQFIHHINF